jgi:undecaprenyl diphosphate synthase
MSLRDQIIREKLPQHVAIIMDGNGRWAKQHGRLRTFGHQAGVKTVREIVEASAETGIKFLTLYTFSTENWKRPTFEINALMELLVRTIGRETPTLQKNNIRLQAIGDLDQLPARIQKQLQKTIQDTEANTGTTLILALSYSARWEIVQATQRIAEKVQQGLLDPQDITEALFTEHLCTRNIPDPELLIRTSGEFRISNYLLWQIAYAELYFSSKLWPDFTQEDFYAALVDFQHRERRFGVTSEQLVKQAL